jgi:opacity protein-like surface antigen
MDERGANIDILFRNGLKDYEVLPPPEAWNYIRPAVRKRQQPIIVLRAAAMIAVIISLSFLAYRWSMEISSGLANNSLIFNPESDAPALVNPGPAVLRSEPGNPFQTSLLSDSRPVILDENNTSTNSAAISSRENVSQETTEALAVRYNPEKRKSGLMALISPLTNSPVIEEYPIQYLPEDPVEVPTDRWTIAALVSPTYYSSFSSDNNTMAENLRSGEQPLFSYSGGVSLSYKVNKRFSVQSGLYYSSFGHQLAGISSFGGFQQYVYSKNDHNFEVLTTSGTIYTSNNDIYLDDNLSSDRIISRCNNDLFDPAKANLQYLDNSLRQNFSYLEFPVFLKYKIVDKAIDFNLIGGLSSNLLVSNSVYTTSNSGKYQVGKTEGLNMITFSSSLGMGMEYSFTSNLSLNLEPTFRYYLNPFSEMSGMKIHPYSFGIFSGLSYKF